LKIKSNRSDPLPSVIILPPTSRGEEGGREIEREGERQREGEEQGERVYVRELEREQFWGVSKIE
jgi:hypothetical protein